MDQSTGKSLLYFILGMLFYFWPGPNTVLQCEPERKQHGLPSIDSEPICGTAGYIYGFVERFTCILICGHPALGFLRKHSATKKKVAGDVRTRKQTGNNRRRKLGAIV